jgi:hypothetical protein
MIVTTAPRDLPQIRLSTPVLCAVLLLPALAILAAVALQPWAPIVYLVRDPLVVAEEAAQCCSAYYGFVSNLGIILWIAAATACALAALLAQVARAEARTTAFLLAGGLFTFWLGLDDLFLVHENVLPTFGVPEKATFAGIAAAGMTYLLVCWRHILTGPTSVFVIAGLCLAMSMGLDAFVHDEAPLWIFLEDALKFLGIVFWAGFHIAAAIAVSADLVTGRRVTIALASGGVTRLTQRAA